MSSHARHFRNAWSSKWISDSFWFFFVEIRNIKWNIKNDSKQETNTYYMFICSSTKNEEEGEEKQTNKHTKCIHKTKQQIHNKILECPQNHKTHSNSENLIWNINCFFLYIKQLYYINRIQEKHRESNKIEKKNKTRKKLISTTAILTVFWCKFSFFF